MNLTKTISRIVIVIFISLIHLTLSSQDKVFTLQNNVDKRIVINKTFSGNTQLKSFISAKPISGLAVSCDITLNSDSSLVRIILIDEQYHEFLVCETYPLLCDSNRFSLKDFAEETAFLYNIVPNTLKIELVDASIHLKEISTSREEKLMAKAAFGKSLQQNSEKINKINENIKKKGGKWLAGETSVSKLSYEEKKHLFGGRVPNLQGFEYYVGGIFVMPEALINEHNSQSSSTQSSLANESPYVPEFSWRNRHGQDWVTSVKNQGECGSCWAFAATGATELLVNLYYNRHLDLDLSEQDAVSCSGEGTCMGGFAYQTLIYFTNTGVVNESCFPYDASDLPCSYKCNNPAENIKISGIECYYLMMNGEDGLKKMIMRGPMCAHILAMKHEMTLVGYKTIKTGDSIYIQNYYRNTWITVPEGDPIIGKTAWLFKNSWGNSWGDMGYIYLVPPTDGLDLSCLALGPVTSINLSDADIACIDTDGDGYYIWGIGKKPAHCPPCPEKPDGDDSDPCLGPVDEYGHIQYITPVPFSNDIHILAGDTVPNLNATGENITWYTDPERTAILHSGNSLSTGQSAPGIYTYYVTQTLSGCESDVKSVSLTIKLNVLPPVAENVTIYPGDSMPNLVAYGENIKWYSNPKNPLYDSRDGQTYATTLIGNQLWMAENLNYSTSSGSWYYNNDSLSFAKIYGRLYNWNTALNSCPLSWYIPSDEEWIELEMFLGMSREEAYKMGQRGSGIGGKLKETDTLLWVSPNTGATNEVGFNARPAGRYRDGEFSDLRKLTHFITASEYDPEAIYFHSLETDYDNVARWFEKMSHGFSVRCILKPSEPLVSGNSYRPVYALPGKYIYYVTQTISGFESPADTVIFTILSDVPAPEVENITVCEGSEVPDLIAQGKNIKWYNDAQLTNLLYSGNTFATGQTSPGSYIYYVTQSRSKYESRPDIVTLIIKPTPVAPLSTNLTVCKGDINQTLNATGENIQWYSDEELTNLLHTGNSFASEQMEPGIYNYYITQTISGCESPAVPVLLTIKALPTEPVANDVNFCEGKQVPDLTATGDSLQWYSDPKLTNLVYSGSSYNTGHSVPGTYTYYLTQTVFGCESPGVLTVLNIIPKPLIELGRDTIISLNNNLILGPFKEQYTYLWNNGTDKPYLIISGAEIGLGTHAISLVATDSNTCQKYDTILLTVINPSKLIGNEINKSLKIYPNPNYGLFNIEFSDLHYDDIIMKIINQKGEEIYIDKICIENANKTLLLNLSSFPPGIYYIKIITNTKQYIGKVVLQ